MTVAGEVDGYLRHVAIERGLSANTVAAYRRDLGVYAEWLGMRGVASLNDVTPAMISEFVMALGSREESPLTASSLARDHPRDRR